jgi:hypothetical protein
LTQQSPFKSADGHQPANAAAVNMQITAESKKQYPLRLVIIFIYLPILNPILDVLV